MINLDINELGLEMVRWWGVVAIVLLVVLLVPILMSEHLILAQLPKRHPSTRMPLVQACNLVLSVLIVLFSSVVFGVDYYHRGWHRVGNMAVMLSWIMITISILEHHRHARRPGYDQRMWWIISGVVASVRLPSAMSALSNPASQLSASLWIILFSLETVMALFGTFQRGTRMGVDYVLPLSVSDGQQMREYSRMVDETDSNIPPTTTTPTTTSNTSSNNDQNCRQTPPPLTSISNTTTTTITNNNNNNTTTTTNKIDIFSEQSVFESMTYSWFTKVLKRGMVTPLVADDLPPLPVEDSCTVSNQDLADAWRRYGQYQSDEKSSLFFACVHAFGGYFMLTGLIKLVNDVSILAGPLLLSMLLDFLEHSNEPSWHGYVLAFGLFLCNELQSLTLAQYFFRGSRLALRMKGAFASLVYQKSLRLSPRARAHFGVGNIMSLMQIDAQKVGDAVRYLHLCWSSPLQITLALTLLYGQLGVSALAGVFVLVLMMPLNAMIGRLQAKYTRTTMAARDNRVKLVNEVVTGVRIIKIFAWELVFFERVKGLRGIELRSVKSNALWSAASTFLLTATPLFVSVLTFTTFVQTGHTLTAVNAFTSLSLFNVLRFPLNALPSTITQIIDVCVSNRRLWTFFRGQEHSQSLADHHQPTTQSPKRRNIPIEPSSSSRYHRIFSNNTPLAPDCVLKPNLAVSLVHASFSHPIVREDKKEKKDGSKKHKDNNNNNINTLNKNNTDSNTDNTNNSSSSRTDQEDNDYIRVLSDVNVDIQKGCLVCIVGAVGCGKSSLIDALLGELETDTGEVWVRGSIALCAQQPWIQNATIQQNILFGAQMDSAWYNEVLDACALLDDLRILPSGDQTEIGERGINLSGGQKHRVALARACYARSDIVLLDDVLSAVDVHVGAHIVNQCINGLLRGSTRVVATHQMHWLSMADHVIVLKDSAVVAQGTYEALVNQGIDFGPLDRNNNNDSNNNNNNNNSNNNNANTDRIVQQQQQQQKPQDRKKKKKDDVSEAKKKQLGKLIEEEDRKVGSVAIRIWQTYATALGLGVFVAVCSLTASTQGLQVMSNFWLGLWSDDILHKTPSFYLTVYSLIALLAAMLGYVNVTVLALASVRAGRRVHDRALLAVLRSPTSFFDRNPIGRILNRFSQDQQIVDVQMRATTQMLVTSIAATAGALASIVYATPLVIIALLPIALVYFRVQRLFRTSAREVKRLDSMSRSPIYDNFSESLAGVATIRAFRKSKQFSEKNQMQIDTNLGMSLTNYVSNRWLGVRLEFLGATIIGATGVVAVYSHSHSHSITTTTTAAGMAGLSLTYALEFTAILNWLIRVFTNSELQMVAVERLMNWERLVPESEMGLELSTTPKSWPQRGEISFQNVTMRYREGHETVLKGVNFLVRAGSHVGVVGRTGSGKSSLLVAVLRMVEIEPEGHILIDGVDIRSVGLHDLRKNISVIPQDPTLFSGTLRDNLDPSFEHSDEEIWEVLNRCSIGDAVRSRDQQLDMAIEPGGDNLSVGQKQLLCLARAMLRKSKILILDEATASVDGDTDVVIQQTLEQHMRDISVITVAHRIHTIMNSDEVVIMDEGMAKEIGKPSDLLQNPESLFSKLVAGTP